MTIPYNPLLKPPLGTPINKARARQLGLVGYWLMNEKAGSTVLDLSGNGNDITNTGGVWNPGKFGSAITVDATDNLALASPIVFGATDKWTVVFWAKKSSDGAAYDGQIVSNNTSANTDYMWLRQGLYFRFCNSSGNLASPTVDTNFDDIWIQYGVRAVDGMITFFTNGINRGGSEITIVNGGGSFNIENLISSGKDYTFIGDVDSLGIFNCDLADSEIALLYREPFWLLKDSNEEAILGGYTAAPPAGIPILRRRIEAA